MTDTNNGTNCPSPRFGKAYLLRWRSSASKLSRQSRNSFCNKVWMIKNNVKIQNCFLAVDQQSHLIQSFGCQWPEKNVADALDSCLVSKLDPISSIQIKR
ncbi:hypothetical protein RO3G_01538 [Rhizopus delemar RA 99-880]|uniref:Uncharacterized protein n=1 Tax=Rhizopus delemar (strain RA 99-880 / ATCC MYA-4621 / FGSC 9543 / NRRL 43880) TaxID=246409 RepID=I1BKV4_RHIO9|nr:hypothetical protein RO3G_01535 [Rhizopus delemar RA 99-880]EIE76834.1 hypothetical protein RO3G_01538 [Rhizopus delemar RA 99-880]|eukprot:EIE76831.1 hypothetical protein RO3G_01535 [Rhizopus delemar RA 99-880]